jgi:hypothetical protein
MFRTDRYRLWTNRTNERGLGVMLETHRRLYNGRRIPASERGVADHCPTEAARRVKTEWHT